MGYHYQSLDSPHIVDRYFWHLLFTYNKSGTALLVLLPELLTFLTLLLRLCLYSTVTCSKTSTLNMFSFSFGFIWSLTNAKGNWSLGLNASISLNMRQEKRLLPNPCLLKIKALSGTSAKTNQCMFKSALAHNWFWMKLFVTIDYSKSPLKMKWFIFRDIYEKDGFYCETHL